MWRRSQRSDLPDLVSVGTGILIRAVSHRNPDPLAIGWEDWVHSHAMTKHDYCKIGSGFPKGSDDGETNRKTKVYFYLLVIEHYM